MMTTENVFWVIKDFWVLALQKHYMPVLYAKYKKGG